MRTRKKSNHFTRSGQVTFHSIRMFFQVNNALIKFIGFGNVIAHPRSDTVASPASRLLG